MILDPPFERISVQDVSSDSPMGNILEREKRLRAMSEIVRRILGCKREDALYVTENRDGEIGILVSNPSWGTQVRYAMPKLVKALAPYATIVDQSAERRSAPTPEHRPPRTSRGSKRPELRIRVASRGDAEVADNHHRSPVQPISADSTAHLREVATYIDNDELASALDRLATRGAT
jgi:hypothetical protein